MEGEYKADKKTPDSAHNALFSYIVASTKKVSLKRDQKLDITIWGSLGIPNARIPKLHLACPFDLKGVQP